MATEYQANKENTMKKLLYITLISICVGLIQGCASWGNGKVDVPFAETPYQAGRTFVFVDTITEPFQPAEVAAAIDQIYAIAEINLDAATLLDEVVQAEINRLYADSTPATRAMIFNIYKAMYDRINFQINTNPDLPKPIVLTEFFRGVKDALAIYQPKG